jgi:hypothetical protein
MKMKMSNKGKNISGIWKELGRKFNLTFSRYISIGNKFLGLDGRKRTLLVAANTSSTDTQVIDLDKLKSFSVRKSYESIKAGQLGKKKFDEFLQFIHLQFEYNDQKIAVIPFYEKGKDDIRNVRKLDRALRKVQEVISALKGRNSRINAMLHSVVQ